ncbi:isopenicillin N synthase family oxygenase [Polymorphobacter sp. PAMC 29334]|uniref:isopenicillin N synthase family dioxygenase n=1 Tax=Polymorphobacter sp. PAMC 29334 TaxID=2862331 RepID=UPI001C746941|nr:2-oxoglutarate and iron-dependent oxygenase domain-containing protein [Polymorphobacter sp. PAMC 29334]QYE36440.1 isopenicillin N synthase family oxygenase [Polymorphobacter sp. PAMC 29334]
MTPGTTADIAPIPLSLVEADLAAAAAAFGDAFGRTGFAVVSDHGIDAALIDRALAATKAFFALPEPVKRRYHIPGGGGQRGLTPFGIETAKGASASDLKEFWHMGRDLPPGDPLRATMPDNVWPSEVPDFHPAVAALFAALDTAGGRVLRAIALHLGLAADFFEGPTHDGNSILRLLHYPPVTGTPAAVRAGAHEDINVITLLLGAEEAGLQLLDRSGVWRDIEAPAGTLVCNIGDMLDRLTGGALPSTTHRVVNPAPDRARVARYSTPFFLHFRPDYLIEPPGGEGVEPITADAFLRQRLREIGLI